LKSSRGLGEMGNCQEKKMNYRKLVRRGALLVKNRARLGSHDPTLSSLRALGSRSDDEGKNEFTTALEATDPVNGNADREPPAASYGARLSGTKRGRKKGKKRKKLKKKVL